jgi:hypothetical protein
MQVRSVECVDLNGMHNTQCDPDTRPDSIQNCDVGIPCTSEVLTTEIDMRSPSSENPIDIDAEDDEFGQEDDGPQMELDSDENPPKVEVKKSKMSEDSEDEEDDDDLEMQGDDPIDRNRNSQFNYQYRIPRADRHHLDPNPVPNEPT